MIATPLTHLISTFCVVMFLGAGSPIPAARSLPPIVFVARAPAPGGPNVVPGFGPHHHTLVTSGELKVRGRNGHVRSLLPPGTFHDVSDPDVSWDGKWIVFSATVSPDSAWRIHVVGANGRNLKAVTRSDRVIDLSALGPGAEDLERYDDIDPCWLPDGRICFASTRYPQISQIGRLPVTNLFVVRRDGTELKRITSERNGAEEPVIHPISGRIIYSRWWFNPYLASEETASGITTDSARAVQAESVNLWQVVSIVPDGDQLQLAGGNPRVRAETMIYEPLVLDDGTLVGVNAREPSLYPDGGKLELRVFPGGFSVPQPLLDSAIGSACAPAALPRGRIMFSCDPRGTGDFGLFAIRPGRRLERVVDLEGTLELDAAVIAPRKRPPIVPASMLDLPATLPVTHQRHFKETGVTFRFDCLNVFTNAAVDAPIPDAPALQPGLRIRFYAALARPGHARGDTVVLVREAPVEASGAIHQTDLPADVPMFEQLIDRNGKVVRSASGPAHVPGYNAGRFGTGTKCVGCHTGHSVIAVARSSFLGKWFNASPSARVSASSTASGHHPRALVDRRSQGKTQEVAWVALSRRNESVGLAWDYPIEVSAVVLYAISLRRKEGTDLRVHESELVFLRNGLEVHRATIGRALSPQGTRLNIQTTTIDAIEVRFLRTQGTVRRRPAVALAEIETIAKLAED